MVFRSQIQPFLSATWAPVVPVSCTVQYRTVCSNPLHQTSFMSLLVFMSAWDWVAEQRVFPAFGCMWGESLDYLRAHRGGGTIWEQTEHWPVLGNPTQEGSEGVCVYVCPCLSVSVDMCVCVCREKGERLVTVVQDWNQRQLHAKSHNETEFLWFGNCSVVSVCNVDMHEMYNTS